MTAHTLDLIVIGAGTGGLKVALTAQQLGLAVALIDDLNPQRQSTRGPTNCTELYTFSTIAHLAKRFAQSENLGLESYPLPPDLKKINLHVNQLSKQLNYSGELRDFEKLGGQLYRGHAEFESPKRVKVDAKRLAATHIVIASGALPTVPAISGLSQVGYLSHHNVFKLKALPERLLIIGGHAHAVEFAQAFALLGSKVFVVAEPTQLLPSLDQELVWQLRDLLESHQVTFCLGATIRDAFKQGYRKVLACVDEQGDEFTLFGNEILVANGYAPNVSNLNLDAANIEYSSRGIKVSPRMRTSQPHIYALGGCIDTPHVDHLQTLQQADVVLNNLIYRWPSKTKPLPLRIIHTEPTLAQIGWTTNHPSRYRGLSILRHDFAALDAAIIHQNAEGRLKLYVKRNKVIGASVLGPQARELAGYLSMAIQFGATPQDLAAMLQPYPSFVEITKKAAQPSVQATRFTAASRSWVAWLRKRLARGFASSH